MLISIIFPFTLFFPKQVFNGEDWVILYKSPQKCPEYSVCTQQVLSPSPTSDDNHQYNLEICAEIWVINSLPHNHGASENKAQRSAEEFLS